MSREAVPSKSVASGTCSGPLSWKLISKPRRWAFVLSCAVLSLVALLAIVLEFQTSWLASRLWAGLAGQVSFSTDSTSKDAIPYPGTGPYDQRLGYSRLREIVSHLEAAGFRLQTQ